MAIYIDANVMRSWRTFAELDRVAISIVAAQIDQQILIPQVVAWEAEAHYARSLHSALGGVRRAHKDLASAFRGEATPPAPTMDIEARVQRWRAELDAVAQILPIEGDDAAEALKREAFGVAPARRALSATGEDEGGTGARDAAIWLAVARDHLGKDEDGHLISYNTRDFGKSGLRKELLLEIQSHPRTLNYYAALDEFLAFLGQRAEPKISLEQLKKRLPGVLRAVLPATADVPRAIFESDFDWQAFRYSTNIREAGPIKLHKAERYEQEGNGITVVNAEWSILADCFRLPSDEEVGPIVGYEGVQLTGNVQLYLPDDENRSGQVVSAQLRAGSLPQPIRGIGG